MEPIVVKKDRLVAIMQANREAHHAIVVEAQEGFRAKVIERLDEMLAAARDGRKIDIAVGLAMPSDHTEEYDRVLGMLDLDIDDTVELDEHEYRQYVQDKWSWEREFTTSNAFCSATAATRL